MYQKFNPNAGYRHEQLQACDPRHPYRPGFHGTFALEIEIGGRKRRMLAYAPADIRDSTAGVIVLGENGKTADDLLRESGWCEIADREPYKEKLIVFFLEPENGIWNTAEAYGTPDGDVAYIDAAAVTAAERYLFCIHESKIYLTGCREGGVLANMAATWNPAFYAGIVTVGGSAVPPEYLQRAGQDFCTNLDGYIDVHHEKNIRKGDIPLPAWIIDDPDAPTGTGEEILNYRCNACGVVRTPRRVDPDQLEYYRTVETPYPLNQEKKAYRVCYSSIKGASAHDARTLLPRIWKDFLYRQRRWMSCPGGDLRVTRDPVRDLGMEYHYEAVDGWMREWYVHIPEAVKAHPEKKVPMVFAMHGYTCSGEIYIGNSGWHQVADQYGFIVVFPSALHGRVSMPDCGLMPDWAPLAAWNVFDEDDRPDELRFFNHMLDRMLADYPVDPARVFASGHSWGSLMTQMLGLGMADRLAGIAPCSGVFFGGASKRMLALPRFQKPSHTQIPVWMHWGTEEEWLIPGQPTHSNETGFTIAMWLKKTGKGEWIPKDWDQVPCEKNGRFWDHKFEKQNTAPVWYTQVDGMPHATMPEMSFRIWKAFFAKLSRTADGRVVYAT
ncbi:MAG: PHB depolymerase family esterase [Eubacteriales bacterium]|nr:PHB depolymerase family esterase [Eubacteriales bacterium]